MFEIGSVKCGRLIIDHLRKKSPSEGFDRNFYLVKCNKCSEIFEVDARAIEKKRCICEKKRSWDDYEGVSVRGVKFLKRLESTYYKSGQRSGVIYKIMCSCGSLYKASVPNCFRTQKTQCKDCVKQAASQLCIERNLTHGLSKTRVYKIWHDMYRRCYQPNNLSYVWYGAKGIRVAKRWHVFENFYEDMGEAPEGLTLERLDRKKNYSKENCCWADLITQANNRSNNRIVIYKGESMTMTELSRLLDIPYRKVQWQLKKGVKPEKIKEEVEKQCSI